MVVTDVLIWVSKHHTSVAPSTNELKEKLLFDMKRGFMESASPGTAYYHELDYLHVYEE